MTAEFTLNDADVREAITEYVRRKYNVVDDRVPVELTELNVSRGHSTETYRFSATVRVRELGSR